MKFRDWVDAKRITSTPLGDFIQDAKDDCNFPNISSFDELESYLMKKGVCDEALEALKKAWRCYEKDHSQGKSVQVPKKIAFQRKLQYAKKEKIPVFSCQKTGTKTMSFFCPYCHKEHNHGLEKNPWNVTHRIAHCHEKNPLSEKGYYVFLSH